LEEFLLSRKIYGPFESFPAHMSVLPRLSWRIFQGSPSKVSLSQSAPQPLQTRQIPDLHAAGVAIVDTIRQENEKPNLM
jgi:hypothetical protein